MLEKNNKERIAKAIARSGICSRREAEKLILDGRIKVNDEIIKHPAYTVSSKDIIYFDNKPIPKAEKTSIWLFHKPPGFITSRQDNLNRPTIYKILPDSMQNLKTIGRLDMNTSGLLLLTNDGELARSLTLPNNKIPRIYKIRVYGTVNNQDLLLLSKGITIDTIEYRPINSEIIKSTSSNTWLQLTLFEGKNREIRNICQYFGWKLDKLIRVQFGSQKLGDLKSGQYSLLSEKELQNLLKSLSNK